MTSGNVTMADLAREAGVSMATVSRALSGREGVAPATKRRVMDAAVRLSYVVSPEASSLRRGATGRIAVLTPVLDDWRVVELLHGAEGALRAAGLEILLYCIDRDVRRTFFDDLPPRRKADATVVLGLTLEREEARRLALVSDVVVAAGGRVPTFPSVLVDEHQSGRTAFDHLVALGHRRIGMVHRGGPVALDDSRVVERLKKESGRTAAYVTGLKAAGLPLDPRLVLRMPSQGVPARHVDHWWAVPDPPTAVYATTDRLALDLLRTTARAAPTLAADLSVTGVGGHPLATFADLTTVGQRDAEQGWLAGQAVVSALTGAAIADRTILPGVLLPRSSTRSHRT